VFSFSPHRSQRLQCTLTEEVFLFVSLIDIFLVLTGTANPLPLDTNILYLLCHYALLLTFLAVLVRLYDLFLAAKTTFKLDALLSRGFPFL
jgi:hypothetical protein